MRRRSAPQWLRLKSSSCWKYTKGASSSRGGALFVWQVNDRPALGQKQKGGGELGDLGESLGLNAVRQIALDEVWSALAFFPAQSK